MTQTTNWREMEAGLELDWIVAQADGWHDDGKERLGENPLHSKLWIGLEKEGEADIRSITFNKSDGSIWSSSLPPYSTDLNAAWELLPITRHIRIVRYTDRGGAAHGAPNEIGCEIWNCDVTPSVMEVVGFGDTPALAICRAFLAWKEAQS